MIVSVAKVSGVSQNLYRENTPLASGIMKFVDHDHPAEIRHPIRSSRSREGGGEAAETTQPLGTNRNMDGAHDHDQRVARPPQDVCFFSREPSFHHRRMEPMSEPWDEPQSGTHCELTLTLHATHRLLVSGSSMHPDKHSDMLAHGVAGEKQRHILVTSTAER